MVSSMSHDTEVLVFGAGPTGPSLGLFLNRLGIDCVVAEKHDGTCNHPQAHVANTRSMEVLRAFGLGLGLDLGFVYEQDVLVPDGSRPPRAEDAHLDYFPCATPGARAPHCVGADAEDPAGVWHTLFGVDDGALLSEVLRRVLMKDSDA